MMWWCAPDRTCSSLLLEQNFGWMLLSQTSKKQNKWLKSWLSDIFFRQYDPHLLMNHCSLLDICFQLLREQNKQQITQATAGTDLVKKCISGLLSGTSMDRIALVDGFGYDAFPALATLEARFFVYGFGDMLPKPNSHFMSWIGRNHAHSATMNATSKTIS